VGYNKYVMRDRIRQILKEEVEKEVSISDILPTLKKIYPELDYCVSEDGNRLKIWTFYMSSFEDMGADPHQPEEFTESGVWVKIHKGGGLDIGTFNDFRDNDGTYYDSDIDRLIVNITLSKPPQDIIKEIVKILDYELDVNVDAMGMESNYGGAPQGDPSHAFEWRKC
jgi:hypothetical protein